MLRQGIFLRNNIPKIPQVPWEGACAPSLGSKTQPGIAWNSELDSGELPPSQFQGFQLLFPPLFPKNRSFAIPGALEPRLRLTSKQGKRLECHGFTRFGHFPWNFEGDSHLPPLPEFHLSFPWDGSSGDVGNSRNLGISIPERNCFCLGATSWLWFNPSSFPKEFLGRSTTGSIGGVE